jgi:hypothetical protein
MKTTPFDNYIIFTNRKLSGGTHPIIVKMLQEGLGIQNAEIIGREEIDTYLTDYPHIADQFGLYKFQAPSSFLRKGIKRCDNCFFRTKQSHFNRGEKLHYIIHCN